MDSFEWNTNYETGIEKVDNQHRRLVDIVNVYGNVYGNHLSEGALDLPGKPSDESSRLKRPMSTMIDADAFKSVNDTYGHDAGDRDCIRFDPEAV